jgi:hypothetical protein
MLSNWTYLCRVESVKKLGFKREEDEIVKGIISISKPQKINSPCELSAVEVPFSWWFVVSWVWLASCISNPKWTPHAPWKPHEHGSGSSPEKQLVRFRSLTGKLHPRCIYIFFSFSFSFEPNKNLHPLQIHVRDSRLFEIQRRENWSM